MYETKLDPLLSGMDLDPSTELVPTNVPGAYSKMRLPGSGAKSSSIASLFHPGALARLMNNDSSGARRFREKILDRKWRPEDQIVPVLGPSKGIKHGFKNLGEVDVNFPPNNRWAGGVIPGGPWTEAYGIWRVPSVSKPAAPQGQQGGWNSSSWVGIDGGKEGTVSNDVLQAGVDQNVSSEGTPSYLAWFEWFIPANLVTSSSPDYVFALPIDNVQVEPGDEVACAVYYVITQGVGQQGELMFWNLERGHYFSMVLAPPIGATFNGDTAEWIMEAPNNGEPITSLPRFSPVIFSTAFSIGPNNTTGDPNNGNTVNIAGFGETQTSVSLQPDMVEIDYIGSNWLYQPLGPAVGAVQVARGTSPTGWFTPTDNFQHIAYVGTDSRTLQIHELFLNIGSNGPWQSNLPSRAVGAVPVEAGTSPTSWFTPTDNFQHIAYVGNDSRIHELFFKIGGNGAWLHNLPSAAPDAVPVAPGTSPTSWFTPTDNVQHIAYIGNDVQTHNNLVIHELFFNIDSNGPWLHNLPSRAIGAVPVTPGTNLTSWFTPTDNIQHIAYVGNDLLIHELFFQIGGDGAWRHNQPSKAQGAPAVAAATSPTGWFTPTDNIQHIAYVGNDLLIHELFFQIGGDGAWRHNQPSKAQGAPPVAAGTSPTSWFTPSDNFQHIAYVGEDLLLHELFFQIGGDGAWRHNLAGAATGAVSAGSGANPTSWFTKTDNVQHIAYVGNDALIHELFFRIGP